MDIYLKVEPQVLISKAGELGAEKNHIMGLMDQTKSYMTALTGTWKSEASEVFQKQFRQTYADIDNIVAVITEYIEDLNDSAGLYINAENAAKSASEGLPVNAVFRV